MRTAVHFAAVLSMALLLRLPSLAAQARSQSAELELTGMVVDELTREPLSGVSVTIPSLTWHTTTDSLGRYRLQGRQPVLDRLTEVEAFVSDYLPEGRLLQLGCHWIEGDRACSLSLDFLMRAWTPEPTASPTCKVSGRMIHAEIFSGIEGMVVVDGTKIGAVADREGFFTLQGVPAGLQRLIASYAGMSQHQRLLQIRCDAPDLGPELSFLLIPVIVT